jgi:hypothetical protein
MANHGSAHKCPICDGSLENFNPRYPKAICEDCSMNLKDEEGFDVSYFNSEMFGGFMSVHVVNGTKVEKQDQTCYCNGIKCYAEESRMGGIVIQTVE